MGEALKKFFGLNKSRLNFRLFQDLKKDAFKCFFFLEKGAFKRFFSINCMKICTLFKS
jgi:hypothetical protein